MSRRRQGQPRECGSSSGSIVARDRAVVRRLAVRQVEQHLVDIAPAPAFRRIVALDDGMAGGMKMLGRVLVGGIIATADVAAAAAEPQMQPRAAGLQAFLTAQGARRHGLYAGDMAAGLAKPGHWALTRPWCRRR